MKILLLRSSYSSSRSTKKKKHNKYRRDRFSYFSYFIPFFFFSSLIFQKVVGGAQRKSLTCAKWRESFFFMLLDSLFRWNLKPKRGRERKFSSFFLCVLLLLPYNSESVRLNMKKFHIISWAYTLLLFSVFISSWGSFLISFFTRGCFVQEITFSSQKKRWWKVPYQVQWIGQSTNLLFLLYSLWTWQVDFFFHDNGWQ